MLLPFFHFLLVCTFIVSPSNLWPPLYNKCKGHMCIVALYFVSLEKEKCVVETVWRGNLPTWDAFSISLG